MFFDEGDSQTLTKIGLTFSQANIYLTLLQIGKANIKTISTFSKIDRSDTYRAILRLQERGLVEQTLGFPNMYKAIPLRDGIKILMEQKKEEYHTIEQNLSYLLEKFTPSISMQNKNEEEQTNFIMVPHNHLLKKRIINELNKTQYNMNTITTAKRFTQLIDQFFLLFKHAAERGIRLRILTEKVDCDNSVSEEIKKLLENPNFEVRCIPSFSHVSVWVFDKKRELIIVDPRLSLEESSAILTNHVGIIALTQYYFEKKWARAHKTIILKHT